MPLEAHTTHSSRRWGSPRPRVLGGIFTALVLPCALAGGARPLQAQVPTYTSPAQDGSPVPHRPGLGNDPMEPLSSGPNPARMEKMREEDRHKRLLADTARLVELTNQLKSEVDKASKNELSLNVVRKAAEIEKLARDVKERMKS